MPSRAIHYVLLVVFGCAVIAACCSLCRPVRFCLFVVFDCAVIAAGCNTPRSRDFAFAFHLYLPRLVLAFCLLPFILFIRDSDCGFAFAFAALRCRLTPVPVNPIILSILMNWSGHRPVVHRF